MFSKVRVAGALLRESHSWYRTHVLSRSSMKPFSWDLGRAGRESGVGPKRGGVCERGRGRPKEKSKLGGASEWGGAWVGAAAKVGGA